MTMRQFSHGGDAVATVLSRGTAAGKCGSAASARTPNSHASPRSSGSTARVVDVDEGVEWASRRTRTERTMTVACTTKTPPKPLAEHDVLASVGSTGDAYDNAMAERACLAVPRIV